MKAEPRPAGAGPAEAPPEGLPRRFGHMTLLKHIARGGMGELYLASAGGIEGAERASVVKIIRKEHAQDDSFLARFLDEARIQSQLQHPGIAQIIEASTDESGMPYVVVEYVEGRNLGEVRHRANQLGVRVDWADVVAVAIALGDALAHVHERTDATGRPLAIAHRDLSPQNVMVAYAGDVKLIDFGTACGQNRRCHTVAGVVFAKPGYVAPEVANNTPGGPPADLYAFGVMIWELLAGRRFLAGDAPEHLAEVAAGRRRPPPLAQLTGAPAQLDRIVAQLTAAKIKDRYQTARHAVSDLVEVLTRAPGLADGDRSVRGRIAHLMRRLYPAEPARSRTEFAALVAEARKKAKVVPLLPPSPEPASAAANDDASLLAGTRYRLTRELGRGGMGIVYEALHVDLYRTVALKLLPKERSADAEFSARFRAEARAIAQLSHENLVKLHDFGVAGDGRPFFAMELLEGETLEQYLERERGMDWREAVALTLQACRAVSAAHAAGVLHRDIKPANLFLTREGTLKLLDFGVAKLGTELDPGSDESALSIVGTPEYLPPEQAQGGDTDQRSDVYALGTVLYELVTGTLPYAADNTVTLLADKRRRPAESPRERAPQRGIPVFLDETILKAIDREPACRFQNAEQFGSALERALREPERQRRTRRRLTLSALGAASALALIAAFLGTPGSKARAWVDASRTRVFSLMVDRLEPATLPATRAAEQAVAALAGVTRSERATLEAGASAEGAVSDELDEASEEAEPPTALEQESERAEAEEDGVPAPDNAGLASEIARASAMMQSGNRIKAFNKLRKLGAAHPESPSALRAWSEAAVKMRAWGEAVRVARSWAKVDDSVEARLHLAHMERAVGRPKKSRAVLRRLLEDHPDCQEARDLLDARSGAPRLALGG